MNVSELMDLNSGAVKFSYKEKVLLRNPFYISDLDKLGISYKYF